MLELAHGRNQEALATLRPAVQLDELLAAPHPLARQAHALMLQAMLRLGETGRVEQALAEIDDEQRESPEIRKAIAALRLAQEDPEAATAVLAPVVASEPVPHPPWLVDALLLEATARDALGDAGAAERALERALALAEPDGARWPFLFNPVPTLLERHQRHHTAHASLVSEIITLLSGTGPMSAPGEPDRLIEPLSESETRILRYLPTNL